MRILTASVCFFATLLCGQVARPDFPGWQGLRVIEQKGRPDILRAADIDADGQEEIIVVNSRSSRLDIYGFRNEPPDEDEAPVDAQRPNELPFAPDIEHQELQLERVPRDVLVQDLDADGRPELIVLVSPPNQVVVFRRQRSGVFEKHYEIDLLDGEIAARRDSLLIRPTGEGKYQLFVSLDNGIQQLQLEPQGRAQWLTPREQRDRVDWWLADLDADGRLDLVEQTRESNESVRWYRCSESGALTPAAVLLDRAVKDVELMRADGAVQLVVLDGTVRDILRRYDLDVGSPSPFGEQRPLALTDGAKSVWCGMWQAGEPALIVADKSAPRLLSYRMSDAGWETQQAYPGLADVQAMAALPAEPGALLLWTKNGADLSVSRWEPGRSEAGRETPGRLAYPEPWPQSADVEERRILALAATGPFTWWVQKVGKHLDLYIAGPDNPQPTPIRFADIGAKADQVLWIGGERVLVKETHSRGLKLIARDGDKAVATSPTHLKKAVLTDFKLIAIGDQVQLGRLTDGVLQWLGSDLRSYEQVMLPQGQELADYVADDEGGGWALQRESRYLHRIHIDASRLSSSMERVRVAEGTGLRRDPILGMLLLGHDRVTQLSAGRPRELKLRDVVDNRVGRAGGVRKTRFHRLGTTDIDRDGYDDLIVYDELQHRLTALAEVDGVLKPKIAWPVFDDKVYPYSDESDNLVHEPRAVRAADFDGDGQQDLVMICHDRLIVYLAREKS